MGLIKFLKGLFGSKKVEDCGCDTPASCPTPEVCKVEVPTEEVVYAEPVVEVVEVKKQTIAKTEKKEVKVISEKLAKVADKKVTAKEIKNKSEFPITSEVTEVLPEKKKPRRRRKPKPKTDEGQV